MIEPNELAHKVSDDLLQFSIGDMLEHGTFGFFLPYQYTAFYKPCDGIGGPAVEDPLTVYASIDVFGDDDRVTFKTTISALLTEVYELYVSGDSELELTSADLTMLTTIRDALANEVNRVDEWIRNANVSDEAPDT